MKNQFTQLWRLGIPMICCLKAGERPKAADGGDPSPSVEDPAEQ